MSRKHYKFRAYFREEPTSYYSLSAVSVKAAIRQAKATCRGLRACPRKPLHVATVENLDVAGWSEGRSMRRFGDGTGFYHLMLAEFDGEHLVTRAACNPKRLTFGVTEKSPGRGHKCRACAKIAARITWEGRPCTK